MKFPKPNNYSVKNILVLDFLVFILVLLGVFFRSVALDWGAPYFFHPDERNIMYSVTKLDASTSLNPDFFAYGSLQIYIIYFASLFYEYIKTGITSDAIFKIPFETAILTSRNLSFIYSCVSIWIGYLIAKQLKFTNTVMRLFILFLTFNVGLIQYSHFGTFESLLTLLCSLYCYFLIKFFLKKKRRYYILSVITFGLLLSSKVSTAVFGGLLVLPLFYLSFKSTSHRAKSHSLFKLTKLGYYSLISFITILSIYIITNPFSLLRYQNFHDSISYETQVAMGELDVFYTGGFKESIPILYQLIKVYPFIINPLSMLLLIFSIILSLIIILRNKLKSKVPTIIPLLFLFLIFFSQAFLYVKWTRYYIPTIPFIYLVIFSSFHLLHKKLKKYCIFFIYLSLILTIIQSFAFVVNTYFSEDTRIAAGKWAELNIPKNSNVLSEVYDLGIIPFNESGYNITLFDFYSLDNTPQALTDLSLKISNSDYFILPSTRVLKSRKTHPTVFPRGNSFYSGLTLNKNYSLVYQTPCNIFCKIAYYGNGMDYFEETTYVFDRPTVSIYKINHEK